MTQTGARQTPRITNQEFQTHRLNQQGEEKRDATRQAFDNLLNTLKEWVPPNNQYYKSLSLEIESACMHAVKGISIQPQNQE